jgi:hypothetical protein
MATLVGRTDVDATTDYLNPDTMYWSTDGHIAVATGTATAAYIRMDSWGDTTGLKVLVYNSGGTLIGTSSVLTGPTVGLVSTPISCSITSAGVYYLAFIATGGYPKILYSSDAWACTYAADAGYYATPPATLPGGSGGSQGFLDIYLDGTTGGGASNITVTLRDALNA